MEYSMAAGGGTRKRYSEDEKNWFLTKIKELEIGPHSNIARQLMQEKWGITPSRSTVRCWVDPQEKVNINRRTTIYRANSELYILGERMVGFRRHKPVDWKNTGHSVINTKRYKKSNCRESALLSRINSAITNFSNKGHKERMKKINNTFTARDLLNKMEEEYYYNCESKDLICYICGEDFNFFTDPWNLDHIDPKGENTLENAAPVHHMCNAVKTSLSMEDLLVLCNKILNFNKKIS